MLDGKPLSPYLRVSQKQGRSGESYIAPHIQRDAINAWAEANGVKLDSGQFDENLSGALPASRRPGLEQLLQRVESGRSSGIIVSSVDRLTRGSKLVEAEIFERLDKAGARFVAVTDGIDTARGGEDAEFTCDLFALLARREWKRYRRLWKEARRRAVEERGQHPSRHVPPGYVRTVIERNPRTGKPVHGPLAIDPIKSPAIAELFRLRARTGGASWTECARFLDERIPREDGGHWTRSAVQKIVKCRVYTGEARHGEFVKMDAHPALVDEATWKAAQPKTGKPKRSSDGALLAGGVVRCVCCGGPLSPGGDRYRCRPRVTVGGVECTAPASARADEIEALVTRGFLHAIAYRPAPPTPTDLASFEHAVTAAKSKLQKWAALDVDNIGADFADRARQLTTDVEAAEEALRRARETAGLDDERLTLAERWGTMTVPERRRALQAFEVVAYVERGPQPVDERVTIELRGSPVADGWEPDVEYTLPSDEELAERITAEFAAAGIVITNVAERIAAWNAKYADAKIVIKPIVLSEEDKATEEAIFGPRARAPRKRARQQAKRQPKATA